MSKMFDISGQFNNYGVPTWQYSDGGPIALIDPRTGLPVFPINKTLSQFLALTPGQVADGAVVHITDLHGLSGAGGVYATWDSVASKWGQNFGAPWVFDTYPLLIASFPLVSKWEGFRFWVKTGVGYGGAELINTVTRYRHTQKGKVLMAQNNTRETMQYSGTGSISSTSLTITATTLGGLTVGSTITGTGITSGTKVTDLGTWNGTVGTLTVSPSQMAALTTITLDKTVEKIKLRWAAPAGFLQPYDLIQIDSHYAKSGTTTANLMARDFRVGLNGDATDASLMNISLDTRISSNKDNIGCDELKSWVIQDATHIQRSGPVGSQDYAGINGTTRDYLQIIPNISNELYFSAGYWCAGATSDFIVFERCGIYLEMGN